MARTSFAVVDATVTHTEPRFRGLAAKYVDWELRQQGANVVSNPADADIVCVTVVSPHEYKCLPTALKRVGVEPLAAKRIRQRVIMGGQGALSPAIFDPYIDAVCVGEGRTFLQTLVRNGYAAACQLPNVWIPGESRLVYPDDVFPWDAPPTMAEDGIVRIYASRGCKKKCLFCQTGWSSAYRENDNDRLLRQYTQLTRAGYRVNVVTNDAAALSFFDSANTVEHFSASYSQMREMLDKGISAIVGKVKSVRFGVEGPSERLRRYIAKPIPTAGLFDVTCQLLNAGIGVRWFMIAGLPGETQEDWQELREVVVKARHAIAKGVLQLSFTAFCPDPAAPLSVLPLNDGYWDRVQAFWKWFFEGEGFTRKVQLFKCAQPPARLRHAMASMAATEPELRRGWFEHDTPNWRVRYLKTPDELRKIAATYARRVGLADARTQAETRGAARLARASRRQGAPVLLDVTG